MKLKTLIMLFAALIFVSACSSSSESDPKPTDKPSATPTPPTGNPDKGELGITMGDLEQDIWEENAPVYIKDTLIIAETSFEATEGGGWWGGDYTGSTIIVNLTPVYEAFQLTEEQFMEAVSMGTIQYVAIESDGNIVTEPTANNYGYWFDADGDVCTHGNSSVIAVETTDFMTYVVSQYPGAAQKGSTYTVKQGLLYTVNEKEYLAVIQINVNVVRDYTPEDFTVVKTFEVDIETSFENGYDGGIYTIPSAMYNEMAQSIGVSNLDNVKYVTLNSDGSQAGDEPLGVQNGWFNELGSSTWGDGIVFFNDDSHGAPSAWNYGCHPRNAKVGDVASVTMQFQNVTTLKAFNLEITIKVID